jgi:hypothetical protein
MVGTKVKRLFKRWNASEASQHPRQPLNQRTKSGPEALKIDANYATGRHWPTGCEKATRKGYPGSRFAFAAVESA